MVTFETISELLTFLGDNARDNYQCWRDDALGVFVAVDKLAIPAELEGVTRLPNSVDNINARLGLLWRE